MHKCGPSNGNIQAVQSLKAEDCKGSESQPEAYSYRCKEGHHQQQ